MLFNLGIVKIESESIGDYVITNWYGIVGAIAIAITGFTMYFLLKTIVDICKKI